MATHKATLAKKNDGDEIEYIFPRTTADLVKYSDNKSVADILDELNNGINTNDFYDKSEIEDLLYVPLDIISLTASPLQIEKGSTGSIKIQWLFNKAPAIFKINDDNVEPSTAGTITFNDIQAPQVYRIFASDNGSRSNESTSIYKTINITECDAIYYGVVESPNNIDSNFINALPNKLIQDTGKCTFTINVESNQYAWFACPEEYDVSFYVNGFNGGFIVKDIIEFANKYNEITAYKIYRSQYSNLGKILIEVK